VLLGLIGTHASAYSLPTLIDYSILGTTATASAESSSSTDKSLPLRDLTVYEAGLNQGFGFCWTFWSCGLPEWSITIDNSTYSSTTNKIVVSIPDGTYTYTITSPAGYEQEPADEVQIDGDINIAVNFSPHR
jgi:hypothetical protein